MSALHSFQMARESVPAEWDDEDALTEDGALEAAAMEFECTPAVIGDALAELGNPDTWTFRSNMVNSDPAGEVPVNVAKLLADEDFTFDGAATTDLIAVMWAGEDKHAIKALHELRERVRGYLESEITERAAELLRAQERANESAEEDAQIARADAVRESYGHVTHGG